MKTVTLQLFNRGQWWNAAELSFGGNKMNSHVTLSYLPDYIRHVPRYDLSDSWACSVNAPVSIVPIDYPGWPALLDDLLPAGESRTWWLNYLNVSRSSAFEQSYALLTKACMAPIGNLRIQEAIEQINYDTAHRFPIESVVQLQHDFLEYANEQGAAVGGATGAGGAAPKLLLMVENNQVFIDGDFAGKALSATPYLTKFARNTRSPRDNNVLKAEGVFYQALAEILQGTDIETIDVDRLMVKEHQGQVSLWLPRFDVAIENSVAARIGLESIYSIINAAPGSYQNHLTVMHTVWERIRNTTQMSSFEFATQYLARDLLNLVFGNSDNHGRNMSFLKFENDIRFAPIYDFAPMKADPEMVTRLFKWSDDCERSGTVRFDQVVEKLSDFGEPDSLLAYLKNLATPLIELPNLLTKLNCPEEILEYPAIGFANIHQKLVSYGVYHA
ncbi:HipA-like protein [Aliidiomarina sedimenti]|uniref:HipA-like protein n=1 Tax=Aliidiomarina sedimenti TaxID=1933879 RepID=A0ABY0C0V0_9GAMM|nr:HipA domain-containing protein [Aliidiomarina sedimenti]RUO30789.1 HipA-like protein [Aliidiomarina sedimenti]